MKSAKQEIFSQANQEFSQAQQKQNITKESIKEEKKIDGSNESDSVSPNSKSQYSFKKDWFSKYPELKLDEWLE